MTKVQSLFLPGPAGRIEALVKFDNGDPPRGLAVICHPHPLHQGTMHNKVVFAVADAFFRLGCVTVRFNFRGVGLSAGRYDHGRGEIEDALAAIRFLRQLHPHLPCHAAGFSFGAWIALEVARQETALASLTAVAPPFRHFEPDFLRELFLPKLFLQGTQDDICPTGDLLERYPGFAEPKELVLLEGAGHFFGRQISDLKEAIQSHRTFLGLS
ncbi:MAG: alpha/beta hydrolase [Acidobacteriota bacterium]